jgi:hypothetical protein
MPSFTASSLRRELADYGVGEKNLITLIGTSPSPDTVDYLDLLPDATGKKPTKILPDGVAEIQDHPLLYVIDHTRLASDAEQRKLEIHQLNRVLGCRGERAYLAVVEPGQLRVFPIAVSRGAPAPGVLYQAGTEEAKTLFSRLGLALGKIEGEPDHPNYLFDELFRLLTHVANRLAEKGIDKGDVLSLAGRALFLRFLRDRYIITERDISQIAPTASGLKACFETPESSAATCAWLDKTFNGDFLPLKDSGSVDFFKTAERKTQGGIFRDLTAVLRNDEPAGSSYQQTLDLDWEDFDFAHVPVGLLSQVYEAFSWKWDPHAKDTSVHYTPRRIASYVVEEAFAGLPKADSARILDPACGAGIFLVLAFRRLYQAKWKATKVRPDTKLIRQILEKQITGFDVSESALRLAALSLYLTAIELDPEPVPPSKLRFKALRDRVLFNWRRKGVDPEQGPVLGSLGDHVGKEHFGAYQVVLCNPPWTSLPRGNKKERAYLDQLAGEFTKLSREVLVRRGLSELAEGYRNPDRNPDLPFIFRSLEWCEANGRIGLVLPGRILFKQNSKQNMVPGFAREALFRAVAVTGIINGSNLSDTQVWPKMGQPFMLLFSQNRRPKSDHVLRFVTPHCDVDLNGRGEIRIDSKSMEPVAVEATFNEPWLWKCLAIGTSLDIDIIKKLRAANGRPVKDYWETDLGLVSGNGYQIKEKQKQDNARYLIELPNLDSTDRFRFVVETNKLKPFTRETACFPRDRNLYRAPMVLMKESPGFDRAKGLALLSVDDDVVFNESFHGFSAFGLGDGKDLARYLHLFIHSSQWMYYALLRSPKFGVERRKIYKSDLDDCPVIPWEKIGASQQKAVVRLSQRLIGEDTGVFEDIDAFFAELYGLTKRDVEVIHDTLAVAMPFKKARKAACAGPTGKQREAFRVRLESALRPFFRKLGQEVCVELWKGSPKSSPYSVLLLRTANAATTVPMGMFEKVIVPLANQSGASRIFQEIEGGLVIAVLNQWRYWTPSRARLCAAEILRNHMAGFEE